MMIHKMRGVFLGIYVEGAYFLRPDTDDEKVLLENFIKKIEEMNPMMEMGEDFP